MPHPGSTIADALFIDEIKLSSIIKVTKGIKFCEISATPKF